MQHKNGRRDDQKEREQHENNKSDGKIYTYIKSYMVVKQRGIWKSIHNLLVARGKQVAYYTYTNM